MNDLRRRLSIPLYFCFFLSGVAGLIYEVLWAKYLSLYVGGTGLAQVIVLATFMGGLALGSHILGRRADHCRNALRFYAFLEFGIAVYALLFSRVFVGGRSLFLWIVEVTGVTGSGLVAAKIASCVVSILLPTFLMGGTMPTLSRHMIRSIQHVGPRIARLYFINSLGAVAGCLLAGFFLVRLFGLEFSMIIGGMLNAVSGLLALWLSRYGEEPGAGGKSEEPRGGADAGRPAWAVVLLLACVSLSGAVSMIYEVAWIRLLTLVLGSSTYSFSIMLAVFILGLSLGGALLSRRRKQTGYTLIFGLSEVAVGLTVLLFLPFYVRLPFWFNQLASSLSREPATFGFYQLAKFAMCGLVMIVPTVLQGITLPAATQILARDMGRLGRRVGLIFAVNTVGTLVGVVFAGFVGLPRLGIKGVLELAVILNGLLGLGVLCTMRERKTRFAALAIGVGASLLVWGWYATQLGSWDRDVISCGVYRTRDRIPSYGALLDRVRERETIFYRDGVDATIAVQNLPAPDPDTVLVINGKVDASIRGDLATQKLIGHLPMLCRPDSRQILVVGAGSGATVGAVLAHDVGHVDVVEISRDVIDASRLFAPVNGRYWEHPRVTVHCEDAKTFLQVRPSLYDVIISEPTNPWIAGVAGVFSREYFEACRDRLEADGLFVQWLQAYEIEDASFYMMLETLSKVFPYYTIWNPTISDTVIVCSRRPYAPDFEYLRETCATPAVAVDLRLMGVHSPLPILAVQMTDRARTPSYVRWTGAEHSDFFPVLEYVAPRGFFVGSTAAGAKRLDDRTRTPANAALWIHDYMEVFPPAPSELRDCYAFAVAQPGLYGGLPATWAMEWCRRCPDSAAAALAAARHGGTETAPAKENFLAVASQDQPDAVARLWCEKAHAAYRARRSSLHLPETDELEKALVALISRRPGLADATLWRWLGELHYDRGEYDGAADALMRASGILAERGGGNEEERIEIGELLCRALLAAGDPVAAATQHRRLLGPFASNTRVILLGSEIHSRLPRSMSPAANR